MVIHPTSHPTKRVVPTFLAFWQKPPSLIRCNPRFTAKRRAWRCPGFMRDRRLRPAQGRRGRSGKRPLRHLVRYLLFALHTGARPGDALTAPFIARSGRSVIDLDQGLFYRKSTGKAATKKPAPGDLQEGVMGFVQQCHRVIAGPNAAQNLLGIALRNRYDILVHIDRGRTGAFRVGANRGDSRGGGNRTCKTGRRC